MHYALISEIKQYLLSKNCEKAYYHCVKVGEYAYQISKRHLISPEKLRILGYLFE